MATKTVSAAGGLFTSGATWVGGVAPVANDDIVANATSGNLTLGANTVSLSGANFTGYTGTLALSTRDFNLISLATITIPASMTITSAGTNSGRFFCLGNITINATGSVGQSVRIPTINAASYVITLNLTNVEIGFGNISSSGTTVNGGNFFYYGTTHTGVVIVQSPYFCFIRPDTTLTMTNNICFNRVVFDTTATITTNGSIFTYPGAYPFSTHIRFDKTPVFLIGAGITQSAISYYNTNNQTHTIDTGTSSIKIDRLNYISAVTGGGTAGSGTIVLLNNTNIGKFIVSPLAAGLPVVYTSPPSVLTLSSTSSVNIDELIVISEQGRASTAAEQSPTANSTFGKNIRLQLSSTGTYSIGTINSSGYVNPEFSPTTTISGTPSAAKVIIGNTFSFDNTQIIDIDNLGSTAYAFAFSNNTLTRVTGITSSFPSSGGGGAGGSFTFVS